MPALNIETAHSVPRVGLMAKLLIAVEILASYPSLLRAVRTNDLAAMVAQARATPARATAVPAEDARAVALRLGVYVQRVLAVLPTDGRCLIRSLILLRLLTRRSIPARVVIGAQAAGGFAAHAWVEHEARAVLPVGTFERLVEL